MADIRSCMVCGNNDHKVRYAAKDCLVSGNIFSIKECTSCGFVFTSDPPDEKDIAGYYVSEDYISHSDRKRNPVDFAYHLARSVMLVKKYRLVNRACKRKTGILLDVGSGTGYFAHYMMKRGWNVTAVELSEQARSFSASKFGISALAPSETEKITDRSFDCITFWHVLEHLYDPVTWLNEVKRLLNDDGRCIIALPNIKSSDAAWFGSNWAALDVPRHLWHFSSDTMIRLAEENGFSCRKIKPLPLDVFYISILSYQNQKVFLPVLRGIITALFLTPGTFFKKERASSLIYIFSKRAC